MILKWNYAFIMKILELLKIYAQIFIIRSSSILRNIGLHFTLKSPKRCILWYQLIKLDKNAKILMSIFNGCRTILDFFTVFSSELLHAIFNYYSIKKTIIWTNTFF